AALAELRGKFRLDLFKSLTKVPGLDGQVEHTLELVDLAGRADTPVSNLAYGEKRRLEVGLALATSPSLLLLAAPLASLRPEPPGARSDRAAAQVDRPRPHHDHHRSRHGLAVRAGRARHRSAGRPGAGRRHAG